VYIFCVKKGNGNYSISSAAIRSPYKEVWELTAKYYSAQVITTIIEFLIRSREIGNQTN